MAGPTHKAQIITMMGRIPQTAYGTVTASGGSFRRVLQSDQTVFDGLGEPAFENDAGYDQGSDLANDIWAITNDAGISIPFDFNFQDVGQYLLDIFGGYSVSGSSPFFTHVFTPQNVNTSRQFPSRTYVKQYGGLKNVLIRDGVSTGFTLTGAKTGRLKGSATVKGSGFYDDNAATYTFPSLESDRNFGYNSQAKIAIERASIGTAQVETATVAGTCTLTGTIVITITSNQVTGSPLAVPVNVTSGDTAAIMAGKVRVKLQQTAAIDEIFVVSGTTTAVVLTSRLKLANDATLNMDLANGTATGLTAAPTSADTTSGVVGDSQAYSCELETWALNLNNPTADDGYRICSTYLVPGDPKSGAVRSEYLCGARDYTFDFEARMATGDKMRGWLKAGYDMELQVTIVDNVSGNSLVFDHNKARVISAKDSIVNGVWIGITGKLQLLATSGTIGLTATLNNATTSYTS